MATAFLKVLGQIASALSTALLAAEVITWAYNALLSRFPPAQSHTLVQMQGVFEWWFWFFCLLSIGTTIARLYYRFEHWLDTRTSARRHKAPEEKYFVHNPDGTSTVITFHNRGDVSREVVDTRSLIITPYPDDFA